MQRIYSKLLTAFSILLLSLSFMTVPVMAAPRDEVCKGVGIVTDGSETCPPTDTTLEATLRNIVNLLSLIVGIIAVIMIIIGGLKYITSSGDSANVTSAKNTILYAVIGLVVVALAQVIVRFVINKVT